MTYKNNMTDRPAGRRTKNGTMMALFAVVSFSILFSPTAVEGTESEMNTSMLSNDTTGKKDWTENETILCAIISIGGLIMFGIFYLGIVRER